MWQTLFRPLWSHSPETLSSGECSLSTGIQIGGDLIAISPLTKNTVRPIHQNSSIATGSREFERLLNDVR